MSNVIQFKKRETPREDEYLSLLQLVSHGCSGGTSVELKRVMIDPAPSSNQKRVFKFIIYAYLITEKAILAYVYSQSNHVFCLEWICENIDPLKMQDEIDQLDSDIISSYKSKGTATIDQSLASEFWLLN